MSDRNGSIVLLSLPLLLSLLLSAVVITAAEQPYQWLSAQGFRLQRLWPLGGSEALPFWLPLITLAGTLLFVGLAWGPLARGRGGGLTGLLLLQRPAPEASDGSSARDEGAYLASLDWRVQLARLPLLALTHLAGLSVGTESPSAALGASCLLGLRRWLTPLRLLPTLLLVAIGGAAGLGTAFRSPLLGVAYGLEELSAVKGFPLVFPTLLLAGLGTVLSEAFGSASEAQPARLAALAQLPLGRLLPPALWPTLLLTTLVMGLLGVLFVRLLIPCSAWVAGLLRSHPWRAALALATAFALLALASGGLSLNDGSLSLGPGLAGDSSSPVWAGLPRLLGPLLSISVGAPGGLMHDTMSLGAVLIAPWIQALPADQQAAVAAVAAAALFSGACRTPLFCGVFVFTLQGDAQLLPWLLVASALAAAIGERWGGSTWNTCQMDRLLASRRQPG
ncbi:chloride channel protein [Synechococcus sp. CBW1006]|nr:chloride channel protein [Synechococcus sp. CBW1006]